MKHLLAFTLFTLCLLGRPAHTHAEDQVFEWKTKTDTFRASFLGFSNGKVYFRDEGRSNSRSYPIEELNEEGQNRVPELYKQSKPFTENPDALEGKWSLTPMAAPPSRGKEYKSIAAGHFDLMGLRAGMTDREAIEVLNKLGAEISPISAMPALETRWLEDIKKVKVPRSEKKYVTEQIYARVFLDASGNPVTDWAKLQNGEYSQTRSFRIRFNENTGTEPNSVVAYEVQMGVTLSSGGDAKQISEMLIQTATSRFGRPKDPGQWKFPHPRVGGEEILIVNSDRIIVDSASWMGSLVSENWEARQEVLKKGDGSAPKSLGF